MAPRIPQINQLVTILFGELNFKVDREDIFKAAIGNSIFTKLIIIMELE
jgi:hypothetical protein